MARKRSALHNWTSGMARSTKLLELGMGGCCCLIDNPIKLNSGYPLIDLASVPARLRSEVELCIKADVIFPFGNSEMERTGAIALFSDKGGG